jgi:LytS/YehU family sensor histidine kinase
VVGERPIVAAWNRVPGFWRAQIGGWGLFALLDVVNFKVTFYDSLHVSLLMALFVAPSLVLISTGLREVYRRVLRHEDVTARSLVVMGLGSVVAAMAIVALLIAIHFVTGLPLPEGTLVENGLIAVIHYVLAFAGWSLCYFWVRAEMDEQREHRHAVQAEAEALRAELARLRVQLDPHFLFNALNGLGEEIAENPEAALGMLRDLVAYLRHSLASIDQTVVTVYAEILAITAYLRVQRARFGKRLQVAVHADGGAHARRIASFLLQPLVENAIKYGRRDDVLVVSLAVRSEGDTLHITVENTGALVPPSDERRRGRPAIGLENVRKRLELHYPGRHRFELTQFSDDPATRPQDNRVIATLALEGEPCSGS